MSRERRERQYPSITRFRYAVCLHKKGDLDAARGQLDHAVTLFGDMEMTWWAWQAAGAD